MQLEAENPSVTARTGIAGCIFNYTNSIIGAGIIGLPYALRIAGFYYGVILLVFVAFLIDWGVRQLVDCGVRRSKLDYELIVEYLFGKPGYYVVTIFMFLFAYGAMIAYNIVIGDVVTPCIQYLNEEGDNSVVYVQRWFIVTIFSVIFMLPLSLLKNMSALSSTSGISITAVLVIVGCVCIMSPSQSADEVDHSEPIPFIRAKFFEAIGTMSFAFVCHHNSFIVYNSLKDANQARWKVVSQVSVGMSVVLSLILSVTGYLYWRDITAADILNNFDYDVMVITVSRILLAITMVFTFPMEQFVARHCVMMILESVFKRFDTKDIEQQSNLYLFYLYTVTLVLWGSSLLIGALSSDLGFVLSLNGSLSASTLGYILPAMVIIKTNSLWAQRKVLWKTRQFLVSFFMLIFGILALVLGTATTILSAITGSSSSSGH